MNIAEAVYRQIKNEKPLRVYDSRVANVTGEQLKNALLVLETKKQVIIQGKKNHFSNWLITPVEPEQVPMKNTTVAVPVEIPPSCSWVAMDNDGTWYAYSEKPTHGIGTFFIENPTADCVEYELNDLPAVDVDDFTKTLQRV